MTDGESGNRGRLQELFLEITGETTVREWQRQDRRDTRSQGGPADPEAREVIEIDIADGLEEAIGTPADDGSGGYSYE